MRPPKLKILVWQVLLITDEVRYLDPLANKYDKDF